MKPRTKRRAFALLLVLAGVIGTFALRSPWSVDTAKLGVLDQRCRRALASAQGDGSVTVTDWFLEHGNAVQVIGPYGSPALATLLHLRWVPALWRRPMTLREGEWVVVATGHPGAVYFLRSDPEVLYESVVADEPGPVELQHHRAGNENSWYPEQRIVRMHLVNR